MRVSAIDNWADKSMYNRERTVKGGGRDIRSSRKEEKLRGKNGYDQWSFPEEKGKERSSNSKRARKSAAPRGARGEQIEYCTGGLR